MAAVVTVNRASAANHDVSVADLDAIRNICRCGTYHRIREAIQAGERKMRPCPVLSFRRLLWAKDRDAWRCRCLPGGLDESWLR
jgi:hypothetical protein